MDTEVSNKKRRGRKPNNITENKKCETTKVDPATNSKSKSNSQAKRVNKKTPLDGVNTETNAVANIKENTQTKIDNLIKPKRKYTKRKNTLNSTETTQETTNTIIHTEIDTQIDIQKQKKGIAKKENINTTNHISPASTHLNNTEHNTRTMVAINNPKKRGRKPRGGKVVAQDIVLNETKTTIKPNIILHLKCNSKDIIEHSLQDLNYNPVIENVKAFNDDEMNEYDKIEFNVQVSVNQLHKNEIHSHISNDGMNKNEETHIDPQSNSISMINENITSKMLWDKLKQLQNNLHFNNVDEKNSDCFWCNHQFDNPPIYIPKFEFNNTYEVYGCFCTPQCACAYLFKEDIDTSMLWERYSLLNSIYCKIYDYTRHIKPAPSPHYLLKKYYGILSIEEYRKMLEHDALFIVVDKPLSRVLPELHDENNEYPSFNYNKTNELLQGQGHGHGHGQSHLNEKKYKLARNKPTPSINTKEMW